jgi:glycolate oxidase
MAYNEVTSEIIAQLEKVAPGRVFLGDDINPDYSKDEMPIYGTRLPSAVVEVLTTEEVSGVMKICHANNIPVTTRGSGTGIVGGAVAIYGGVVLCTSRMTKIIGFDENQFCVMTQPGVLIKDLKEACLERGFFYPPDPGQKLGTIGGNVSTNAGGMRAIKYGTTKDYVRAMTVVMPDGEIVQIGNNVAKTSMGYNIAQLITGAEGTLAIITELKLKMILAPKFDVTILAPFKDLDAALEAVPGLHKNFRATAIEFFERPMLLMAEKYVGKDVFAKEVEGTKVDAYLLLIFDGDSMDEIDRNVERVAEFLLENGALDVMVADTPASKKEIWDVRGVFLDVIFETHELFDENDVVVPIDKIAEFVRFFTAEAEKYDFDLVHLGHAGDGNLHIFGTSNTMEREEFKRQIDLWMVAMYDRAKEMGGDLSGEHGVGYGKIKYFEDFVEPRVIDLHRQLKKVFDPKLILNPGKIVSGVVQN